MELPNVIIEQLLNQKKLMHSHKNILQGIRAQMAKAATYILNRTCPSNYEENIHTSYGLEGNYHSKI